MNIAFDSVAFLGAMSKNRGIGNYASAQFKAMLEADKGNQYFCLNYFGEPAFGETPGRLHEAFFYCGRDRFLTADPYYKNVFKGIIQKFLKEHAIDVFYVTSPFDGSIAPYPREWFGGVRVAATVYDIIPYVMQGEYLADKNTRNWYMRCFEHAKHFDKYLAISNSVKQDLMTHMGVPGGKIEVMHGAPGGMFKKIEATAEQKRRLFGKYGLEDGFILCIGGDDPRKNIGGLIEAYAKLPKGLAAAHMLAVACKLSGHAERMYGDIIAGHGLNGRVALTGFVPDEDLLLLYNTARLLAFPSKYEGFGLPVAEAFACGLPVLTSNNSALGEIAEGAAVLVDPFDTGDIARGLELALSGAGPDVQSGYEKLKFYSWGNTASIAIAALQSLARPAAAPPAKPKLACFAPLPPLESGISDYSVDILNRLDAYFDIDVFIDDGYEPACALNSRIKVHSHKLFKAGGYAHILYQVGNSSYHVYMFPYIKKHKGTVVLHDCNLHLVAAYCSIFTKTDFKLYEAYLREDMPAAEAKERAGKAEIKRGGTYHPDYGTELNGFVVNYASKVIVHSEHAKEKLLRKDISRQVRTIRSYALLLPLKCPVRAPKIVLGTFGHLHESKRILALLNAFKGISEKHGNVECVFCGKMDPNLAPAFYDFVKRHKLENKIEVTGHTSLEDFNARIDATDICLNLRHPYNGETSGSLMRILAKGKCAVVNDIGSFSEIPDGCCVKLPDAGAMSARQEAGVLQEALERLIADPALRESIGGAARKYAEKHLDINVIAKEYYDFITDTRANALNEEMLQMISGCELKPKNYSGEETAMLSRTLAYTL